MGHSLTKQLGYLLKNSLKKGDFVLTSGKVSKYYLNARCATLTPEGAYLSASLIVDFVRKNKITSVGGPTIGADPLVGAIAYLAYLKKYPLKTFIIRKSPKIHADRKQIEGPELTKKEVVLLIDDVATTGKSLVESVQIIRNSGSKITKALVLVDREEGARENLNKLGVELHSILKLMDIL